MCDMDKTIGEHYAENFDTLVKRFNRRSGGKENAEDVVQEAYLRALKYKTSFSPDRQEFGAWFNTILNNSLVAHQKMVMLQGLSTPYEEDGEDECYECAEEDKLFIGQVLESIGDRCDRSRNILYLFFVRGYRLIEIQEVVGGGYRGIQMLVLRFKEERRRAHGASLVAS